MFSRAQLQIPEISSNDQKISSVAIKRGRFLQIRPGDYPTLRSIARDATRWDTNVATLFVDTEDLLSFSMTNGNTVSIPLGSMEGVMSGSLVPSIEQLCVENAFTDDDVPAEAKASVLHYAKHFRADSTFRSWRTCWSLVLEFCHRFDRIPLPMSPGVAASIAAEMASAGYSLGWIRNVRSTIARAHGFKGLPDPTKTPAFAQVFEGIARRIGDDRPNAKKAFLFAEMQAAAKMAHEHNSTKSIQEWAIISTSFHAVLRRANLISLDIEELSFPDERARIWLPKSKTDQHKKGREIFIDPIPQDALVCPVRALRAWLGQVKSTTGPLFRHLGPKMLITGKRLSDRTVARIVQDYAGKMGLKEADYGAQSTRAGFITQSILNRVPEIEIAQQSGHSQINTLRRYHRPGSQRINMSVGATYGYTPRSASSLTEPAPAGMS